MFITEVSVLCLLKFVNAGNQAKTLQHSQNETGTASHQIRRARIYCVW